MSLPTIDYASGLSKGDKIDLKNPPQHCGAPMDVHEENGGVLVVCCEEDYQFHADENGVLVEPPFVTR